MTAEREEGAAGGNPSEEGAAGASPTEEGAAAAAPNPGEAKERILRWVAELGLSQAGVAPPEPPLRSGFLLEWLRRGYHASMHYLARDPALRTDPRRLLDGCASVICVALDYPSGRDPGECDPSIARIARYAWGDDYHDLLKAKLRDLAARIEAAWPGTRTRVAVDTSPVLERAFAARAGLGWPGKHTNLISPERGSYFFLGELFTTLALPPDEPVADHCGTCRRCLEVCPTGAFPEPYVLDARRCISYLTIEHRGPIDPGYHAGIGNWIFGCDLCQEVCPWNREAPGGPAGDLLFRPREGNLGRPVEEWESLDVDGYRERFRRSAVKRARFDGMVRNIAIAAANAADARRATGASATEALARAGPTREASMSAGREVELYGAAWSPESRVARRFLEQHGVAYRWIEVEGDVKARVQEGAGTQSLPVLRIDGEWFRASARDRGFLFRETAERLGIPAAEVPELRDRPPDRPPDRPAGSGAGAVEKVAIASPINRATLAGDLHRPAAAMAGAEGAAQLGVARGAVLIVHGWKGFKDWGFFPHLAARLASRGFATLRCNLSGCGIRGEGDGDRFDDPEGLESNTLSKELADVAAALDFLETAAPPGTPIALLGHSRGGGIAIVQAARDPRVRALVTWSAISFVNRFGAEAEAAWLAGGTVPIVNTRTNQVFRLRRDYYDDILAHADLFDLPAQAGRVAVPWLLVHGEQDETVPIAEAERLHEASRGHARLLRIAGGGHTFGAAHPFAGVPAPLAEAIDATESFLAEHFGQNQNR